MLADENAIFRAGFLRDANPLLAIEPFGVERGSGHRLAVPIAVAGEERADAKMEENSKFPVEKLELLLCRFDLHA